jgi:NAD(P)-dependent dehydrogenase (short-subunit alcohol dehydrogenase family)
MTLEDRAAVVTGGGRGIGAATARALAAAGARVVVSARTAAEIDSVRDELVGQGYEVWSVACDVTDSEQVEDLAVRARQSVGPVQILINNAGVASSAPLKDLALAEWQRLMAVNATAPFLCTRAFMPGMLEAGWGRVINVASIAGKVGAPYIAGYCASKHAVVGFTRAVAAEVAAHGVTVNAVCPGYVDTPMTDRSVANIASRTGRSEAEARAHLHSVSPQNRLLEAEEVASLIVSLCQPASRGINGQAIVLDGGTVQS